MFSHISILSTRDSLRHSSLNSLILSRTTSPSTTATSLNALTPFNWSNVHPLLFAMHNAANRHSTTLKL